MKLASNVRMAHSLTWTLVLTGAPLLLCSHPSIASEYPQDSEVNTEAQIDWDARYEAYLKANPRIQSALDNGTITKEQIIAGLKARENRRPQRERQAKPSNQDASNMTPEHRELARTTGAFDFTLKLDLEAIGIPGMVINTEGTSNAQFILDNKFVFEQSSSTLADTLSITGWREDSKEYFVFTLDSNRTPLGYAQGSMINDNTMVMKDPSGMLVTTSTFQPDGGTKWEMMIGPTNAVLATGRNTPVQRRVGNLLGTIMRSPIKPTEVNRSAGKDDPAENFAPEHLELQQYCGNYRAQESNETVISRMVCKGRYLLNISMADGAITQVSIVAFDNSQKMFQMAMFDAGSTIPRYFDGKSNGTGGIKFRDPFDPATTITVQPRDGAGYTASFPEGSNGEMRELNFVPDTSNRGSRGR